MNEIVKYHNNLNLISFKGFSEGELNILFAIFSKLKEQGNKTLLISFAEFKEIISYERSNQRFEILLSNTFQKIQQLIIKENNKTMFSQYILFPTIEANKKEKEIKINVNDCFLNLFNKLRNNFTRFELIEFTNISSKYTKNIYRLLKQYKQTGMLKINFENFKEILDIPKKYTMSDIDKRIIKPAIKELTEETNLFNQRRVFFENLRYIKKKQQGKGNKIQEIIFLFNSENQIPQDDESEYLSQKYNNKIFEYLDIQYKISKVIMIEKNKTYEVFGTNQKTNEINIFNFHSKSDIEKYTTLFETKKIKRTII